MLMNNPLSFVQAMRNPQVFIQNMMKNNEVMKNPILKNTMEMAQSGNSKGVEELARNLCKEKGINADEALNKIKSQFGIN